MTSAPRSITGSPVSASVPARSCSDSTVAPSLHSMISIRVSRRSTRRAGTGLALAPLASTVLARVPPDRAGSASGLLTTALQIGNAIGVAIIGVVFYHALGYSAGRTAYAYAFRISLVYLVAVALFLAVVVRLLPAERVGQET